MQTEPGEGDIAPAKPYRFEPAWGVHAIALLALAASAAPLWALAPWAPGLAFAAPPLIGFCVVRAGRRAHEAGRAAFVQARLAETVTAIGDPQARAEEAEAAWRQTPRTPAAAGWLFWAYAGLGLLNAAAVFGWTIAALGFFSVSASAGALIAGAVTALYGLGFVWAAIGVIAAAVRPGGQAPNTEHLAQARLIGELRAGRARAEAMALEAALLAAIACMMAVMIAQALGLALVDLVRAAWPAPVEVRALGIAVPAPNLRELEAPLWRAKLAVSALLAAAGAFLAMLILRTPLVETLARLAGAVAEAEALRAAGYVPAAVELEGAARRRAGELAPLRLVLTAVRAIALAALAAGLGLGLGLLEPGLATATAVVIAAAILLMALERARQALLAGRFGG